jgi:hypothetical protein
MDKMKMIKKDAVIDIKIGTGFFQKLQKLLLNVASDLTPEQLEKYRKEAVAAVSSDDFSEDWMNNLTTISVLLKEIEVEAEKQGHTFESNLEDAITQQGD